ncbi:MAG: DUF3553 domain-containing protein [Dongiaceae bacterium]
MNERLLPGALVRHPNRPDWGIGQIQSVIGNRITANFEHAGKLLIDGSVIRLEVVDPETSGSSGKGPDDA